MAIAIAGCGGGGAGSNSTVATNPAAVTKFAASAWQSLKPQIDPASISVSMAADSTGAVKPVVTFKVTDELGNPLVGLGGQVVGTSAALPANFNPQFTLAKLIPANATTGEPSKWVSYLVTAPVLTAGTGGALATVSGWTGTYPTSDTNGTLVDNNDGTYKYTFLRDIKAVQSQVNALVDTTAASTATEKAANCKVGDKVVCSKADLDPANLAYDPAATHRLGIIIQGSQPGTGTNTPDKVQVTAPVPLLDTFNIGYDFVPNGGAVTATRDIVVKASCATCHDNRAIGHFTRGPDAARGIPGGAFVGRNDPRLCVTCHTDQTKYSFTAVTTDANGNYTGKYKRTVDEQSAFTYPRMIHQYHMGEKLTKTGYNLNGHCTSPADTSGVTPAGTTTSSNASACFNTVALPQAQENCSTCHAGTASTKATTANANKTPDGDNWKTQPSIIACGSCHDGINFADGTGFTLADKRLGKATPTGHLAGIGATANSSCAGCHTAAGINPSVATSEIALVHRTTDQTPNNPVSKAGVSNFSYEIKSVTVTANQPVIVFRIIKDGAPVTAFNVPTPVVNGQTGATVVSSSFEPITGFAGGPSLYVTYAVPQDGIAAPADFNAYQNVSLTNLLVASGSPKAGSITGPDVNGWVTATLTGDTLGQAASATCTAVALGTTAAPGTNATCITTATTVGTTTTKSANASPVLASPIVIPTNATMVTGAIIGVFTQKNQPTGKGVTPPVATYVTADPTVNPNVSAKGGLRRPAVLKKLVATGYTARRVIVDAAKCNSCHEQLGTDPVFHSADRNDPTACAICHNANKTSTGWSANSNTFIHGIHGASKRTVPFDWVKSYGFADVGYPGILKDCNQCHLPNTVNLSATGGTTVAPNMLWLTVGTGTYTASTTKPNSIYVTEGTNYGNLFSFTPAGATVGAYTPSTGPAVAAHVAAAGGETVAADPATLVSSPLSSACFSCHDSSLARTHMHQNGGAIYEARSTVSDARKALVNSETCLACHGAGKLADAAAVHGAK
jgi:OmcA/MtrC family decaheme c-type cytochrome